MGTLLIIIGLAALIIAFKKINSIELPDKPKLQIELVPASMHGCNVRSRLSAMQWKYICNTTHDTPKYQLKTCSICGENGKAQGFPHALECHEQWEYDTSTRTQKLVNLLSICPLCHKVFHFGLSARTGYGDKAFNHLKKVNKWNDEKALAYIEEAKAKVKKQSKIDWELDLTFLNKSKYSYLKTKFTTTEKFNCNTSMGEY